MDRRAFLSGGAGVVAGGVGGVLLVDRGGGAPGESGAASPASEGVVFRGRHQAGIATPSQRHATVAAFDVTERERATVGDLLAPWTDLAEQLTAGRSVHGDSGEATGMGPARLTITFGFGPTFFDDACAARSARPAGLVALPEFPGDQLEPAWNGGDVVVQVCAEDPTVVSHALRQLRRAARGVATVRWNQAGFLPQAAGSTPRNLFGQVDGTVNPRDGAALDDLVWVDEGPDWMLGGTYLATRRIRMMLTMWDRMGLEVQESTVGRRRSDGAPLTGGTERSEPDLDATRDGELVIASDAHVRVAKLAGPGMLRRGYSFDDGPRAVTVEVEVPAVMDHAEHGRMDHSAMTAAMDDHDAGLMFAAFVKDPESQFVAVQQALSTNDALGHFLAYTSADLWAIPRGAESGPIAGELLA